MITAFIVTAIIAVACFIYTEWHIKDNIFFNTGKGEIILYIIFFIPVIIFTIITLKH